MNTPICDRDSNGTDVELESSEFTFSQPKNKRVNNLISSVISGNSAGRGKITFDDSEKMVEMDDSMIASRQDNRPISVNRRIKRMMSQVHLPRLITRDYPYNQSSTRVGIFNKNTKVLGTLLFKDWFHILLRYPFWASVPFCLMAWYISIWIWAAIYVSIDGSVANVDQNCGLGKPGIPMNIGTAYAFSLETFTTVGYDLPGSTRGFFNENCYGIQTAITLQMIWSMLYNAFLAAFFFALLSKSENRSIQLIFSNKLCINVVDGRVCANVRCYDIDSSFPLVECHVRMYLVDHKMKFHPLRLLEPNDELGGVLYPSAPTTVVHHIDHHSALSPGSMPLTEGNHGLTLRSIDSATAGREEIVCPVCGEAYGTYARLVKHIRYARIVEEKDDYPKESSHLGFQLPDTSPITLEEVQRHIERKLSEIVVVVEATDPQLSGTFQSVQSYKYEDIEFGADFERCLFANNNKFECDLQKFHGVIYDDDMYAKSFEGTWTARMSAKNDDVNVVNSPQRHNFPEKSNNTCILEENSSDIFEENEKE